MVEASPSDVRVDIETHLDDSDITAIISRTAREIDRAYEDTDVTFADTQHRQDFEAALAALRIAEGRDRRASDVSTGGTSETYETAEIDNLRKRVRRDDPGDQFGRSGKVVRDTGRFSATTGDGA